MHVYACICICACISTRAHTDKWVQNCAYSDVHLLTRRVYTLMICVIHVSILWSVRWEVKGCNTFSLPCFLPIRFWCRVLNLSCNWHCTLDATLCSIVSQVICNTLSMLQCACYALYFLKWIAACSWCNALNLSSSWQHTLDAILLRFVSFFWLSLFCSRVWTVDR